jgi:hypothetical protein
MPAIAPPPNRTCAQRRRRSPHRSPHRHTRLGSYRDDCGRRRELVALRARAGSLLVVDRDADTLADRRLVAHLGADEPAGNAALVCRSYLSHPSGRRCRRLRPGDLLAVPSGDPFTTPPGRHARAELHLPASLAPVAAGGYLHGLRPFERERSVVELRWCRRSQRSSTGQWEPVGLRDVIAALESYEPVRSITAAAIACRRHDPKLSLRRLCAEYRWLCTSPVVLNRALREAVLRAIEGDELSMSEIALRCGVLKRDRHGKPSGETSWLARRVGLMPEGGAKRITPWIHSDVLALIAREGLCVSPREVEVP